MSIKCFSRAFLFFLVGLGALPQVSATVYESNPDLWRVEGDGVRFGEAHGRPAIRISTGRAILDDIGFENGDIEFDVYLSGDRAFVYLQFRGASETEFEDVYLRPHKSGLPDSVQYSPVFQGRSAWQLYHGEGGTGAAVLPPNQWVTIKLALSGSEAKVYVGDETVLTMNRLGHAPAPGWIALRGFVPRNSTAEYAAYFSNLKIKPSDSPSPKSAPAEPLSETYVTTWRVSPAFDAPSGPVLSLPEGLEAESWSTPIMQPNGVFEFLRSRTVPENSRHWAVVADVTLEASEARTCAIHLGFSDEITLSLNRQLLLYRDAAYRFASPRQDGVMHPDQVIAFLPLEMGSNTLRAVIADRFGGWGLSARLADCDGVKGL